MLPSSLMSMKLHMHRKQDLKLSSTQTCAVHSPFPASNKKNYSQNQVITYTQKTKMQSTATPSLLGPLHNYVTLKTAVFDPPTNRHAWSRFHRPTHSGVT